MERRRHLSLAALACCGGVVGVSLRLALTLPDRGAGAAALTILGINLAGAFLVGALWEYTDTVPLGRPRARAIRAERAAQAAQAAQTTRAAQTTQAARAERAERAARAAHTAQTECAAKAARARVFLGTGILGGFTTYSALATGVVSLAEERWVAAAGYGLGSVVGGLICAYAGVVVTATVLARRAGRAGRVTRVRRAGL